MITLINGQSNSNLMSDLFMLDKKLILAIWY